MRIGSIQCGVVALAIAAAAGCGNDKAACPGLECNGTCCAAGEVCANGACASSCTPEDDAAFCARVGKRCGAVTAPDNCGASRSVASCGSCEGTGESCVDGVCTCTPKTEAQLCEEAGRRCGPIEATDNCGAARKIASCGICTGTGETCTAQGTCHCEPKAEAELCFEHGARCGALSVTDNCGATRAIASCGGCPGRGEDCTALNLCSCDPRTEEQVCADAGAACGALTAFDNCGQIRHIAACGDCTGTGEACEAGSCVCHPKTEAQLCFEADAHCGTITATDNCGTSRTIACGTCTGTGEDCEAHHCQCHAKTEAQLCADAGASCGAITATDNCGATRSVAGCGACLGTGQACESGQCVCHAKSDAELCADAGAVCGSIRRVDNCGAARVVASCGDCLRPMACNANRNLCQAPGVPLNDACVAPEALNFGDTGTAHVAGDLSRATESGQTLTCGGYGNDLVYTLTLAQGQRVEIDMTPGVGFTGKPVLSLRTTCGDNKTELVCLSSPVGQTDSLVMPRLEAGTYYLWVDGDSFQQGVFDLTVQLKPAAAALANDRCTAPTQLSLASGFVAVNGTTDGAHDDYQGSCAGTYNLAGGDVVYEFTLGQEAAVTARIARAATAPANFRPAIYFRSTCASAASGDEAGCSLAGMSDPAVLARTLGAGTWYLIVDGTSAGDYVLELSAMPAMTNGRCAAAMPLLFDGAGVAAVIGDTNFGVSEQNGCANSGKELVYTFTTSGTQTVEALVTPFGSGSTWPGVYIRSACGDDTTTQACAAASGEGRAVRVTAPALPKGTYYVFVDTWSSVDSMYGPFTLEVRLDSATAPANGVCSGAVPLTFDSFGRVTVSASSANSANATTSEAPCPSQNGPEMIYKFTLGTVSAVSAKVTRAATDTSFSPSIYLRSSCSDAATQLACSAPTGTSVASSWLTLPSLAGGTYYLVVDSPAVTNRGSFTLELSKSAPKANDTCGGARALDLSSGSASVVDDTSFAANDLAVASSSGCGSNSAGNDLTYTFTTTGEKDVQVRVAPETTSAARHLVYLRAACDESTTELGCSLAASDGSAVRIVKNRLPAGTYYVVVDGVDGLANGPFTLSVTATDSPAAPVNDTCSSPLLLAFDQLTGHAYASGDTSVARDDYSGSGYCSQPSSGGDVVYQFTLRVDSWVQARAWRAATDTFFKPMIYIRGASCTSLSSSDQMACANEYEGTATLSGTALSAGTYWLIVDGANNNRVENVNPQGSFGRYWLDVAQRPVNDCGAPTPLAFGLDGVATVHDDTSLQPYGNLYGNCSSSGKEVVYSFTTSGTKNVDVQVMPVAGAAAKHSVYLRTTCGFSSGEVACSAATQPGQSIAFRQQIAANTWFLVVDGAGWGDSGEYTLRVELTDPAPVALPNDACANATHLEFDDAGMVAVNGSTWGAADDFAPSCQSGTGGDVAYAITLGQRAAVSVTVTRGSVDPGYAPVVYLRSTCDSDAAADEKACGSNTVNAATVAAAVKVLDPGTYYVIVDGAAGSAGDFGLQIRRMAAITNDSCGAPDAPASLTFDAGYAEVTSDLSVLDAVNTTDPTCNSGSGPDAVYTFTTLDAMTVRAQMEALGSWGRPNIYLRKVCDDNAAAKELACAVSEASSSVAELFIPTLPAGTYYLWADSYSMGQKGPYTLRTWVTPPLPPPANATCAGAQQLVFTGTTATADGETTWAPNSRQSTCDAAGGNDVVYYFTTTQAQRVVAQVERAASSPSYLPLVYLRRACADGEASAEITCGQNGAATATATVNDLGAGTYYVVVDGAGNTYGSFTLTVRLSAPVAGPSNESCGFVQSIPMTGPSAIVTGATSGGQNESTGSCAATGGPDVVYSFTIAQDQKVTAEVVPGSANVNFKPAVYLRRSCGSFAAADELVCAYNSGWVPPYPTTAVAKVVTPGTYYVWVDAGGWGSSEGDFTLNLTLSAPIYPPVNDTCAGALALAFVNGTATASSSTADANNETTGAGCWPASGTPDVYYSFTVTQLQSVSVAVTPADGNQFHPWVAIRRDCASSAAADELACGGSGYSAPFTATASLNVVSPGTTYFIVVDSYDSSYRAGAFTLTATLAAPILPPANDTCAGVIALSLNTPVTASTTAAANDYTSTAGNCGGTSGAAPDVVYSYTPTANGSFSVSVAPGGSGWDAVVWIGSGTCGEPASCLSRADQLSATTSPEVASVSNATAGTTYYIVVDGYNSSSAGTFTITVN